jgi:hypothetical protein
MTPCFVLSMVPSLRRVVALSYKFFLVRFAVLDQNPVCNNYYNYVVKNVTVIVSLDSPSCEVRLRIRNPMVSSGRYPTDHWAVPFEVR